MLKWRKEGLLFSPADRFQWMREYAQVPTTLLLEDRLRVYFSCRPLPEADGSYVSYSGYVDLAKDDLHRVLDVSQRPIIELGGRGDFDQYGTMAGTVLHNKSETWLYYCGWTRCAAVPYNWAIGLAVSEDGGRTFRRAGKGPILGPTKDEPYLQACPVVLKKGDDDWRMWYLSGLEWIERGAKMESVYVLMHAASKDGINWNRNGAPIIQPVVEHECQTSAAVFELDGEYHMLFSYRHGLNFRNADRGYRIGYARSSDMATWRRDDSLAGIRRSESGWDSEMICYPHVFELDGRHHLLYCGNAFGIDGFGHATLIR